MIFFLPVGKNTIPNELQMTNELKKSAMQLCRSWTGYFSSNVRCSMLFSDFRDCFRINHKSIFFVQCVQSWYLFFVFLLLSFAVSVFIKYCLPLTSLKDRKSKTIYTNLSGKMRCLQMSTIIISNLGKYFQNTPK